MNVIKFISLIVAIWFSIVNFGSIIYGQGVSKANIIIQSLSIATFTFIQFNLF